MPEENASAKTAKTMQSRDSVTKRRLGENADLNTERAENMEGKALQDIFIKILRSELTETELDASVKEQLTPDVVSALYSLADRHDLAQIVSSSLYKCGIQSDDAVYSKFYQKEIMSIYRDERMKYTYGQICDVFNQASIPYIPLKGSVIRPYYPKESMRTSCDIDILVKEEDLEAAIDALVQKGFQYRKRGYHDVSLLSDAKALLELHFNILENNDKLDAVLKDAWHYAQLTDGSRYEFTDAFFVFYMFSHISYHFLNGGCGMKALMDIWIIEHKMGITYECARELLEKTGIYQFAAEISKLAEICFSDKTKDEFADTLLSFIFSGGVYGTPQNKIAVKKTKTKSTLLYTVQRLFLPYKKMIILYPALKKLPFLLPFCWISRLCKMLFGGKAKDTIRELKTANNMSEDKINTIMRIRERLGL